MPHGTTEKMRIEADAPRWAPVIAIGLSTFAVVTTEMLPVGLMTPMNSSSPGPLRAMPRLIADNTSLAIRIRLTP